MSILNHKQTNEKLFYIATIIAILNQSLLPFLDKAYIDSTNFNFYVKLQVASVCVYLLNFIIVRLNGYKEIHLHIFMLYTFIWGIIAQFIIPSAYLTYVICLFVYAIFVKVNTRNFLIIAGSSFILTALSIYFSEASYSTSQLFQEKFKMDAIQSVLILSSFIWATHLMKNKEQAKTELIESKLLNLGTHSASIIHDIKSQLMSPLNYSQMLLSNNLSSDDSSLIKQELSDCLSNMKIYITEANRMFSFKKEQGNINLTELIEKIQIVLNSKTKNIVFKVDQTDPLVLEDINEFKTMIYNLILNSCEAFGSTRDTKEIHISFKDNIFKYYDNAGGMDLAVLKKLKNQVFTTSKENGSGLGMFFILKYIQDNPSWSFSISNITEDLQTGFCLIIKNIKRLK